MSIRVSELGFVAFLMLKKEYKLEEYREGFFYFKEDSDISELRVEWVNSDFAKFDKILLDLKHFKIKNKN
jgi:hypothetical protein